MKYVKYQVKRQLKDSANLEKQFWEYGEFQLALLIMQQSDVSNSLNMIKCIYI